MSRRIAWLLVLVGVAGLGFAAGATIAAVRGWGSPVVRVDVENLSTQAVKSVVIDYQSCGHAASLPPRSLAHGKSTTFLFQVCGEGDYTITAHLESGAELKRTGGYVENGYVSTEIINGADIMSPGPPHLWVMSL